MALASSTGEVSVWDAGGKTSRRVLVRGGGRISDREILQRTRDVLAQGASGIVYGRNVIQHPSPSGITRALMTVVHKDASVEDALALLGVAAHLSGRGRGLAGMQLGLSPAGKR